MNVLRLIEMLKDADPCTEVFVRTRDGFEQIWAVEVDWPAEAGVPLEQPDDLPEQPDEVYEVVVLEVD